MTGPDPLTPYSNKQGYKSSTLQTPKPEQEQEAIYCKAYFLRDPKTWSAEEHWIRIKTDFSLHMWKNAHSIVFNIYLNSYILLVYFYFF